jgi:putative membrane protein
MAPIMNGETPFSEADRAAILAAVRAAEGGTAGEIVPYVVGESDPYPSAVWKGAALGALCFPLAAVVAFWLTDLWGAHPALWMVVPVLAGAALGYLLTAWFPAVRRSLIGDAMLELRTRRRAETAFLEEEVFNTTDRTGILLFLSLFEHRVVVLGDTGINAKVRQEEWDGLVSRLARGIREGRADAALVEAVGECGALLARKGVEITPRDVNELPDELRERES